MENNIYPYGVYINIDPQGRVYDINSDEFIPDLTGWIKIDEGYGDRYHHAQGNYLPGPLMDDRGVYCHMAAPVADWPDREVVHRFQHEGVEWAIYERTAEEMDADYVPEEPGDGDLAKQVAELQQRVDEQAALLAAYEAAYTEGVNEA